MHTREMEGQAGRGECEENRQVTRVFKGDAYARHTICTPLKGTGTEKEVRSNAEHTEKERGEHTERKGNERER